MAKYSIVELVTIWYTYFNKIKEMESLEDIVKQIEQIGELQLDEIISAVIHRYNALHADRELGFLSLPTDPRTRDKELEDIFSFIHSCYNRLK